MGVFGLLGNLTTVIIVLRPEMRSNFHQSILALAIVDMLFVSLLVIDVFRLDLDIQNQTYILLFPYFLNPLKNILLCCETYLVMSIATERLMAVSKPIKFRLKNLHYSSRVHFCTFILPTIVLAVIINIPKFFETSLVFVEVWDYSDRMVRGSSY